MHVTSYRTEKSNMNKCSNKGKMISLKRPMRMLDMGKKFKKMPMAKKKMKMIK